jgi:hypothetical protein
MHAEQSPDSLENGGVAATNLVQVDGASIWRHDLASDFENRFFVIRFVAHWIARQKVTY